MSLSQREQQLAYEVERLKHQMAAVLDLLGIDRREQERNEYMDAARTGNSKNVKLALKRIIDRNKEARHDQVRLGQTGCGEHTARVDAVAR